MARLRRLVYYIYLIVKMVVIIVGGDGGRDTAAGAYSRHTVPVFKHGVMIHGRILTCPHAIPRIHPSRSATRRSSSVSDGWKYRSKKPRLSVSVNHRATQ